MVIRPQLLSDSTHSQQREVEASLLLAPLALAGAVAGLDLGTQEGEVDVRFTGGLLGAANLSDFCAVVFI